MTIGKEPPDCLTSWKLVKDRLAKKKELRAKAALELEDQHKQYQDQLGMDDHPEQVSAQLVEGRGKDEAAESHFVRNDIKLPQVPLCGGKKYHSKPSWGLRDFPYLPKVSPLQKPR